MKSGGFAGRVLFVDLNRREVVSKPLDLESAGRFIGGLGMNIKLYSDRMKPGADALSPENPVVLGAGPFVGTDIPSSSRVYSVSRLPSSGTVGWSGAGGVNFGCMLKNAGYDHVVIEGKADRPVFLKVEDHGVEICDAGPLWGQGVEETCEALWGSFGRSAGVLCIGEAGENRVAFSMAYIDRIATLGRGGFGAVMGSKNLKAVVAKGGRGVAVADRKRYRALRKTLLKEIREYPYLKEWQELGLVKSFPMIPRDIYQGIKKRRIACVSCPIGCKDVVEIPDGEFKGFCAYSSSVVNLFIPVLYGMSDHREAIRLVAALDGYGLDMFEFFGVMQFARTLGDQGVIPLEGLDPRIRLDSLSSMMSWARKIALRQGLGELLARGFKGILSEFGREANDHAPSLVKGMHPYAGPGSALSWDLFGTMELGQVLDPRGPHVGSGGSPTYFARRPLEVFPRHLARMGVPEEAVERILPGADSGQAGEELKVGRLLKHAHCWFTILGSVGVCARAQINRFYNAQLCAEFYEAVTGIPTDLLGLRQRAERVWTLYRMVNLKGGYSREGQEALPEQWFRTPGFKEYVTEKPLAREVSEQMIEDYYEEWGWDRRTGRPTAERLQELGLKEA